VAMVIAAANRGMALAQPQKKAIECDDLRGLAIAICRSRLARLSAGLGYHPAAVLHRRAQHYLRVRVAGYARRCHARWELAFAPTKAWQCGRPGAQRWHTDRVADHVVVDGPPGVPRR